ncbi:MAG: hypothetical protein Q8M83_03760 [bacterium]|nr:hypothetical protein [bacterium]
MRELVHVLQPHDLSKQFIADQRALEKKWPFAYEKLYRLHQLYLSVKDKQPEIGQEIIAQHILQTAGNLLTPATAYAAITSAIKAAKAFLASMVHEFIPELFRLPFTSDGVSTPTDDPLELLKIIWNPPGCSNFASLRSFEANLFWHLGMKYLLMRLQQKPLESQLRDLTLWLENDLFVTAPDAQNQQTIITCDYDPQNANRFSTFRTGHQLLFPIFYRLIEVEDARGRKKQVLVIYESRIKKEPDLFRKILLYSKDEIPLAGDSCAITLVCFSEEECQLVMEKLRRSFFNNGGAITNLKIKGNGGKENSFSSSLSEPETKFRAFVHGGLVECQIFLFPNFFNRHLSLGEENHHLYRLSQVLPLFALFFPPALYGISWSDDAVKQRLRDLQIHRIMANYPAAA